MDLAKHGGYTVPLVIPPGFGNAAFIFDGTAGTPQFVTTLGVEIGTDPALYVPTANSLFQAYAQNLMSRTYSGLTLTKVSLAIGADGPSGSIDSDLAPVNGGLAGADAALSMSVIAQKRTGRIGRSGRGRMFLPGLLANEDVNPNGDFSNAVKTAIQTDVNGFFEDVLTGAALGEGNIPYLFHAEGTEGDADPTAITSIQVQSKVGWVRKRIR